MALFSNTSIGNIYELNEALAKGSHFKVNDKNKLETLGFFSGLKRSFLNKIGWYSPETIMARDKGVMEAMTKFVGSSNTMSGAVNLEKLNPGERDIVIPYDKLAAVKNNIAEIYIEEKLTVKNLMARHQFSRDDATLVRKCLLNNIDSGFFRSMVVNCNRMDAICERVDTLVAGMKNEKGAFLMGLDPNNSFPEIWKDIKDTKLCKMHNLAMDSLLGKVVQDFEDWTASDEGKTAGKSDMALWLKNSCPTLRLASVVYPRNHGYSAYKGSFEDKMRLGSLLQDDPSALAFALNHLGMIQRGAGELTPENIWKFTFFEDMPPKAQGADFSSVFSARVDAWLKQHLLPPTNTADNLALMRRLVKEFRPEEVASIMQMTKSGSWSPDLSIGNSNMIDPSATLTIVPNKVETPIESVLLDLAKSPPVMRPNRDGIIEPQIPVLDIENDRALVGDPDNWGTPYIEKGENEGEREITFERGPKSEEDPIVFSDDDIKNYRNGSYLSNYFGFIKHKVREVCRGNVEQFEAVMRLMSQDRLDPMIGDEGLLHGLPGVSLIKSSGSDKKINRETDGSVRVEIISGQPVDRKGWLMSVSFLVDQDGSSELSKYELKPGAFAQASGRLVFSDAELEQYRHIYRRREPSHRDPEKEDV